MNFVCRLPSIVLLCATAFTFVCSMPEAHAYTYSSISGDNSHEWITNVSFGDIDNTSGKNPGAYGNYMYDAANIFTRVTPGGTYPLRVTIQPDTQWCNEYLYAYINWNHDGDFNDAGEKVILANKTCEPGPHTANITVPSSAKGGETPLRIVLRYKGTPPPSGKIPEGEAEDYTLVVDYPKVIGDNRAEWITNVTFGDINNSSAQDTDGYGDYSFWTTGNMTEVTEGETYPLSVTISPDLDLCEENISAFFDWNQDGDFRDSGERVPVATDTCLTTPHTADVRIPGYARPGRTPMRIIVNWKYPPPNTGYVFGEGEDYTVFVIGTFSWNMFLPAIIKEKK